MAEVLADGRVAGVAVFDLDGTLTWRDTLLPYLAGYLVRHRSGLLRAWRLPAAIAEYALTRDRGRLKSRVISILIGGASRRDVDAWTSVFVDGMTRRRLFRPAALAVLEQHRAAGDHLVLLSASPDLYVPRIGELLRFERTLCTELKWRGRGDPEDRLDGALLTPNRRGAEKIRCIAWLRRQYPGLRVTAYGNSESDLPHLETVDRAMLVNGGPATRRKARQRGIAVDSWT